MHKGVFIGHHAPDRPRRVLILGESHHVGNSNRDRLGQEAEYTTESVLREDYYGNPFHRHYRIYDKIIRSFGRDPEVPGAREDFWEAVYFGNYIPVLCGVRTGDAATLLRDEANRRRYNNELFGFVNGNGIDVLFCFSRLVYRSLPGFSADAAVRALEDLGGIECGRVGNSRDHVDRCRYCAGVPHSAVDILLQKELAVFGMRHPSARGGYDPSNYAQTLKAALETV